jgi:hypothetical protein
MQETNLKGKEECWGHYTNPEGRKEEMLDSWHKDPSMRVSSSPRGRLGYGPGHCKK